MTNPNNCETCDHKKNPDGGHCYMFRDAPTEVCYVHTMRDAHNIDIDALKCTILTFKEQKELKPCPFCGHQLDVEDGDTLYPSGLYWRVTDDITHYIRLKERQEGDQPCWKIVCNTSAGGCDVEMHADTEEELIEKWNRRV